MRHLESKMITARFHISLFLLSVLFYFEFGNNIEIKFFRIICQQFSVYIQLWDQIYQCIDAAFYLKEFV